MTDDVDELVAALAAAHTEIARLRADRDAAVRRAEAAERLVAVLGEPRRYEHLMDRDEHPMDRVAFDGESYATGRTINGPHCGRCGRPVGDDPATTTCCGFGRCLGIVTDTPWIGQRTGLETWACCIGVAERAASEPVTLRLGEHTRRRLG